MSWGYLKIIENINKPNKLVAAAAPEGREEGEKEVVEAAAPAVSCGKPKQVWQVIPVVSSAKQKTEEDAKLFLATLATNHQQASWSDSVFVVLALCLDYYYFG